MVKNGLNRERFFGALACLILLAQLVVIKISFLRYYIRSVEGIMWVIIIPVGLMTLSAIFYFYYFILRPQKPMTEKNFVFSYLFLRFWGGILIVCGFIIGLFLMLGLLIGVEQLVKKVFLALWPIANVSLFLISLKQLKSLKTTETYHIIDERIRRASYGIKSRRKIKKLDLSNIHWFIVCCAPFILVGLGLLIGVIITFIKGKWEGGIAFLFFIIVFLAIFIIIPTKMLLGLLETMLARPVVPAFFKKLKKPTLLSKPSLPKNPIFTDLLFLSLILIVLFGVSMFILMGAISNWKINCYSQGIIQFIGAIICSLIGLGVFISWLQGCQKEKRMRKPSYDIETIAAIQKGVLIIGHIFGYLLIIGGLILIHQLGATKFTIKIINVEIPWLSFLWGCLTLSSLILIHQYIKESYLYPDGWTPPLIIRLTETIAKPFQAFPLLNLSWLSLDSRELFLSLKSRLLGKPIEKPKEDVALTLPEAKSLAESIAMKRDKEAYLFALQNGEEGLNPNDQRAKEWRFSYYLPKNRRQLDIVVAKGEAKAKRSKTFSEPAPEKIPDDWINPEPVIKTTQEALHTIFAEPEKEQFTFSLYFPALRFSESLGDEKLPEKPCWLVSVFDTDTTLIQNYLIDPQTHQLLKPLASDLSTKEN